MSIRPTVLLSSCMMQPWGPIRHSLLLEALAWHFGYRRVGALACACGKASGQDEQPRCWLLRVGDACHTYRTSCWRGTVRASWHGRAWNRLSSRGLFIVTMACYRRKSITLASEAGELSRLRRLRRLSVGDPCNRM